MGSLVLNTRALEVVPDSAFEGDDLSEFAREMSRRAHQAREKKELVGPPEPQRTPPAREGKPRKGLHPLLLLMPLAGAGADAYTTDRYFDAVREADERPDVVATGREDNPILRGIADNDGALYGTKAGVGLGLSGLAELAARKGHKNLGKGIAIAATIWPLILAARNHARTEALKRSLP